MYPRSTNKKTSYKERKIAAVAKVLRGARATSYSSGASYSGTSMRPGGWTGRWTGRGGRSELKTIDTTATNANPTATGSVVLLNGVATGDDYNTRDGRKILMKSILLRLFLKPDVTQSAPTGDILRVMLVYDKQTNAAALTAAMVLQTATYASPNLLDNRERFKVLLDKYLVIGADVYTAGALVQGAPLSRCLTSYKTLNLETTYNGTGATVGAINTGSVYLVMLTRSEVSSVDYYARVRFTEP